MKIFARTLVLSFAYVLAIASSANCDNFSEKPPSNEELIPMVSTVLNAYAQDFCFSRNSSADIRQDARAVFISFGKSANVEVKSVEVRQVGTYNGYWPIKLHTTATCTLQYRSDFAQNSPAFSHWRGRRMTTEISTVIGINARRDDFGRFQVELRQ